MADGKSPQLEDGNTRIANELLEAMCRAGLSARQWAVVMVVVRKTYGYGKKADDISLSQFESITGIAKPHVSRAVNDLIAANVLRRTAGTFGNRLSMNKRYQQWTLGKQASGVTESVTKGLPKEQRQLPKEQPQEGVTNTATPVTDSVTGNGVTDSVIGVTDSVTGYRFGHAEVTDSVTTKGNSTKERKDSRTILPDGTCETPPPPKTKTGTDDPGPEFLQAWGIYPKRSGGNPRKAAWMAWRARIRAADATAEEMTAGVGRYAAYCKASGSIGTRFVMMACTFFGPDGHYREDYEIDTEGRTNGSGSRYSGTGNSAEDHFEGAL